MKLIVDPEISQRSAEFCAVTEAAIQNVKKFAKENGLERYLSQPIASSVEFVKDRQRLEQRLREIYQVPPETQFPPGMSAGNDSKEILLMMPEEEAKKYSAKFVEPGFYEKLATHELIHLLHIRMVEGQEDEMGPIWFFEGFPTVAARQLESFEWPEFKSECAAVISDPKRGDYRKYAFMVRRLAKKFSIVNLVERARKTDFDQWATQQLQEEPK